MDAESKSCSDADELLQRELTQAPVPQVLGGFSTRLALAALVGRLLRATAYNCRSRSDLVAITATPAGVSSRASQTLAKEMFDMTAAYSPASVRSSPDA